jgi:DNA processing protein
MYNNNENDMNTACQQALNGLSKADLAWEAASPSHHILTLMDEAYPSCLREIAKPPLILYVKGQVEVLKARQLAIVGTRKPTPGGRAMAAHFAQGLVQAGFLVTSGLALGIDGVAHEAALTAGGQTIAVIGSGFHQLYPARHGRLAERIASAGALISEFSVDTPPNAYNFPRRNRIISGLSEGVLVVEAALRSGSLITARHALEQNREVFAIPGSVNNLMAQGCHALLKQGAKLVENLADILEELSPKVEYKTKNKAGILGKNCSNLSHEEQILVQALGFDVVSIDELVARTGLNVQTVARRLVELEFLGLVQSTPGGYVRAWEAQHERECA